MQQDVFAAGGQMRTCSLVLLFVLRAERVSSIAHAPDFAQGTSGTGTESAITKAVSGKVVGQKSFFCPQLSVQVFFS